MTEQKILARYLRIFSDDETIGDSMSISGQRSLLEEFVNSHSELKDWKVIEFSDDGYSGTTFQRPGMTKLLEGVRRGEIQGIIVKDLSRFGRNYIEVGDYLEQIFPFLGIRFISVNDGFDSAKQDCSAGDISIAFKNLLHDYYSKDISNKLRAVWKLKKERGEYISPVAFFGYTKSKDNKHKLVVDEPAAVIVRRIFSLILEGNTTGQIARLLNTERVPSPGAYKLKNNRPCNGNKLSRENPWTGTTVYNIVRDLRYTGCMVNGKRAYDTIASKKFRLLPREQWIICENTHEGIVSKELFEKAQLCIKKSKRRTQKHETPLLSGKVRCGICGYMMQPSADKQQKYRCRRPQYAEAGSCSTEGIPRKHIEEVVLSSARILVNNLMLRDKQERIPRHADTFSTNMEQLRSLKKSIESIKRKKIILYEQYSDALIPKSKYLEQRDVCDSQLQELEKLSAVIEKQRQAEDALPEPPVLNLLRETDLNAGLTRELVEALVDQILVYDETHIEVVWQFSDDFIKGAIQHETKEFHETA